MDKRAPVLASSTTMATHVDKYAVPHTLAAAGRAGQAIAIRVKRIIVRTITIDNAASRPAKIKREVLRSITESDSGPISAELRRARRSPPVSQSRPASATRHNVRRGDNGRSRALF